MKPSGPGLLCARSFLITALVSPAIIGLFRISAATLLSFGSLYFSRTCPFHLGFQISWHVVAHSNFLQSFVFLWYQLLLLPFHF